MKRRVFNILAVLSLLMFIGIGVLWVRSYWVCDFVRVNIQYSTNGRFLVPGASSDSGLLVLMYCRLPYFLFDVRSGITYERQKPSPDYRPDSLARRWGFGYRDVAKDLGWPARSVWQAMVPHWLPFLGASALPVAWMVRESKRRRLAREGRCANCGYDLRASKERCPECGRAVETKDGKQ